MLMAYPLDSHAAYVETFSAGEGVVGMWNSRTGSLEFYSSSADGEGELMQENPREGIQFRWWSYYYRAKRIVIGDGVTKVSKNAFKGFENVETVIISSTTLT